jgi:pyrroline-5-carboxylate reductase
MVGPAAGVTIGVIGTGSMGSALVRGWSRAPGAQIRLIVWDKITEAAQRVAHYDKVVCAESPEQLVAEATFVIVVVKPKDAGAVLGSIAPLLRDDQVLVSSMAGVGLDQIREIVGPAPILFRVMPNLGVEVGAGAVAISAEPDVAPDVERRVVELFRALGLTVVVLEDMLDAVTAVSGTGPALLALALEGLEDGGVAAGLPRDLARAVARRAVLDTARTLAAGEGAAGGSAASAARADGAGGLEERPASVGDLEERPASVGDLLGQSLALLEERGVRLAFRQAVEAASARARELRAQAGAQAGTRAGAKS